MFISYKSPFLFFFRDVYNACLYCPTHEMILTKNRKCLLTSALAAYILTGINANAMMHKKIELSLRTIDLSYDELKPFHPFEEEILERYTQLHQFVTELFEEYETVQNKYCKHKQHIEQASHHLSQLNEQLRILENNARHTMSRVVVDKHAVEMTAADAGTFFKAMYEFNTTMQELADESEQMYLVFTPLNSKDELFTELFDEYKEFRSNTRNQKEEFSFDSEQFEEDEKDFFHAISNMAERQEEFIETCNNVIDQYNQLIDQTEGLYQRWEKYNKTLEVIKLMYVMPNDISRVCLN